MHKIFQHNLSRRVEEWTASSKKATGWPESPVPSAMGHSAKDTEVVALIFAKHNVVDPQAWQQLFGNVTSNLKAHFGYLDGSGAPHVRFLDQTPDAASGRVAELKLLTRTTTSIRECKAFTDADLMKAFQQQNNVEIILQPGVLYAAHRTAGLAVFDMDSTLIQQEVIDELARAVGLYDQVAAITEAAMRGEAPYTDFAASLRARVALLKGVPHSVWEQLKTNSITFTPGARELLYVLKKLGWKSALLSGGFSPLATWVKDSLAMDYAHANHLVSDPVLEKLTGELVEQAPIIDGAKKRELLLQISDENGIPSACAVAVGDGSNDLLMMGAAGLGVAFNAKRKVQEAAPTRLNSPSLLDIMYILGYTKVEVDAILASVR